MKNVIVLLYCTLLGLGAWGQRKEFFQLDYRDKPNFKERNNFLKDTIWRFNQIVEYDVPKMFDEESWVRLTVEIKDTAAFLATRLLTLPADLSKAAYQFAAWTVWLAKIPPDSTTITGKIELLNSSDDKITLKLDLAVKNTVSNNLYYYKGERVFRRTYSINEFYRR